MLKRILWFVGINIAFMATITIIFSVLSFLFPSVMQNLFAAQRNNANIGSIIIYSGIVGFTSAFFTLAISRWYAKKFMGVQLIENSGEQYGFVLDIVQKQSEIMGLKMPEVGFFVDNTMNAFATGPTKNKSLVAFSTGLLDKMSIDGIEAVSAHELAHIKNGDMVTMTLIQGVVNTLVLTASKLLANLVNKVTDSEIAYHLTYVVSQIVFGILSLPISAYFSRIREFSADSDAAKIVGAQKMVTALKELKGDFYSHQGEEQEVNSFYKTMRISGEHNGSIFDTHPTLENRINALNNM